MAEKVCIAHGKGRLGNIMFSLATGLYYARQTGRKFYYLYDPEDIEHYNNYYERELNYGIFHKVDTILDLNNFDISRIEFKREVHATYSPLSESNADIVFIDGWRLNSRYFTREFAIEIFGPGNDILDYIHNIYADIDFENCVSINVRRGDYLQYVGMGYVVNELPFYEKVFANYPADQKYVITSDDIEWCKEVFKGDNFYFIDKPTFKFQKMWVDLYIPGLCKDNIISNSTFSWWGAFLNPHMDRKVYYQYPFYKNERDDGYTYDAILPDDDNWIPIREIDIMKVAVMAPVRNENRYLREWVEYYKNLGVDNVILFDNNPFVGEKIAEVVGDYIMSGFVILHDVRQQQIDVTNGVHFRQMTSQHFYDIYGSNYDWVCCLGVDEYIKMVDYDNIKKFIAYQTKFSIYDVIVLNQMLYDDNGLLEYDGRPLHERFTHRSTARYNDDNRFVRCIIKGRMPGERINFIESRCKYNPFNFERHRKNACCDSAGNEMSYLPEALDRFFDPTVISKKWLPDFSRAYVVHFKDKTITEYCEKIINRYPGIFTAPKEFRMKLIEQFFTRNVYTDEKQRIAERMLQVDNDDYWKERNNKVAVCAIIMLDNLYLRRWCDHYKNLGVDNIYLYDCNNIDSERPADVIGDYIESGFVKVIDWRGHKSPVWLTLQTLAFNDFNAKYSHLFAWTCYFEIDEFFVFKNGCTNIKEYLDNHKLLEFAVIGVNCEFYNSDGQQITGQQHLDYTMKSIVRSGCSTKINWLGNNEPYMPLSLRKQEKITADLHGNDIIFLDCTNNWEPSPNHTLYMEPTGNDIAVLEVRKWHGIEDYLGRIYRPLLSYGAERHADLMKDCAKELILTYFDYNEPTPETDKVIDAWHRLINDCNNGSTS